MGFWNGRVTFTRYRVSGSSPLPFGEEILDQAAKHLIGLHGAADPADGIATGWAGGDHVLDLNLESGKNIVDDALHLAIRIDTDKIPGPLLRAYTQIETEATGPFEPQRHRDQGPAPGSQGGRQAPRRIRSRRRPVPPSQSLPGTLGWTIEHMYAGSTSTIGPRSAPSPVPRNFRSPSRANYGRQPGLRSDSGRPRRAGGPGREPGSGPAGSGRREGDETSSITWADDDNPPTTTSATNSWSGSGTRFRTTETR